MPVRGVRAGLLERQVRSSGIHYVPPQTVSEERLLQQTGPSDFGALPRHSSARGGHFGALPVSFGTAVLEGDVVLTLPCPGVEGRFVSVPDLLLALQGQADLLGELGPQVEQPLLVGAFGAVLPVGPPVADVVHVVEQAQVACGALDSELALDLCYALHKRQIAPLAQKVLV